MSELADAARVHVLLADYALGEAGKINILGGSWSLTQAVGGGLPQQSLVVVVEIPGRYREEEFPVVCTLRDAHNLPVEVPAEALGGQMTAIRIAQLVRAPALPGVPKDVMAQVHWTVNMPPGLPLPPGRYTWEVEVDGATRADWSVGFYVMPDAPPPPVIG